MHDHRGLIGGRDEAHNVLTMAIICSMWCGWLSQAKINRRAYPPEWVDNFKKTIVDAFEIGRDYAAETLSESIFGNNLFSMSITI